MGLNIFPTSLTSADSLVVWKAFQQGDAQMMTHWELEYPSFLLDEVKNHYLSYFFSYILHSLRTRQEHIYKRLLLDLRLKVN